MNREELLSYRSRVVRDLAWAISLPSLVRPIWPPAPRGVGEPASMGSVPITTNPRLWIGDGAFLHAYRRVKPLLRRLDENDTPLREYLSQYGSLRHGIRFERLLEYWFQIDPVITFIAADVQINGLEKTLGQIDFIVEWEGEVLQIEVAVKFYLQMGEVHELARYFGTDLRDRMDRKIAHMLFHQRRVTPPSEVQPRPDRSVLSLRGILFPSLYSPGRVGSTSAGRGSLPEYWWARFDDFAVLPEAHRNTLRWTMGTRLHWFSPVAVNEVHWYSFGELLEEITEMSQPGRKQTTMVIASEDGPAGDEISRGFVLF